MASNVEKLCRIVSCLGGPSYSPNELEWATQITAGNTLINWIVTQLPSDIDIDDDCSLRAALLRIALEDEEVKMLQQCGAPTSNLKADLSNYVSPSRQSSRTALVENSTYAIEKQVSLLQHRLRQTKAVSHQLQKTAHVINAELERVQGGIDAKQEELELLSMRADSTISNNCSKYSELFKFLEENLKPDSSVAFLTECLDDRTQIIQRVSNQLACIDTWKARLPSTKNLDLEVLRLENALGMGESAASLVLSAEEVAYNQHLKVLINTLEAVDGDDGEIYDILQEVRIEGFSHHPPDIGKELELAWNRDQYTILKGYASVLEEASSQFYQTVCSLENLHTVLAEQDTIIQKTLATLRDLQQELDAIEQDLAGATAKSHQRTPHDSFPNADSDSEIEESQLKGLLKRLQGFRPSDSSPLVLLDQNDVLSELELLKRREESLNVREEQWCSSIPMALNSLMSMQEPALTATYSHSAMNTSPPYQLSPSVAILQREAKVKSEVLSSQVQRLQKDILILDDNRTHRKLKAFVERWNLLSK
ncbi:hypothetical protein BDP27DRAFT_1318446 [Rhodocollybia butyracea]|uniref:Uncharacterized protein n=1 Tax=Rhodocollybia butyracea TaxID=206335 RepID=A0A9P5Q2Q8_9AGAR|nr:hypothetical protein BDP27DRAFT_1318446 [Rhodocollybia butyracea]